MNNEITEINTDMYCVKKWDDIKRLPRDELQHFIRILTNIDVDRKDRGKKNNTYLVLNMDDEISVKWLSKKINNWNEKTRFGFNPIPIKVKDIATDVVNAILCKIKGSDKYCKSLLPR